MTSTRVSDFRIADWLPVGVRVEDVIVVAAGLAVLLMVLAIWSALTTDNSFERRVAQITQGTQALRKKALATERRKRSDSVGLMRTLVTKLNLLRSQHADQARTMLMKAGFRSQDAMVRYLFALIATPLLFGAALLFNGYVLHLVPIPDNYTLLAAVGGVAAGFYAPRTYLKNIATRRAQLMELGLPDGLDLLVICAEAGLSLDAALNRVSRELGPTWPELSEELAITAAELTFLPDRNQAFENLNTRTDLDSIRGVVNTLQQTLKFGTPLARSLRVLAGEFRQQRMNKAEAKAARLPAMLTVPMIIFILPTLFIVMLGPAALGVIDVFSGNSSEASTSVATGTGAAGAPPKVAMAKRPAAHRGVPAGTSDAAGNEPDAEGLAGAAAAGGGAPTTTIGGPTTPRAGYAASQIAPQTSPASYKPATPRNASLMVTATEIRIVDPVVVDVDARALRSGSDQRLVVVRAGTKDAIADEAAFARVSTGILPVKTRVLLAPAAPGPNEVRLYDIPPGESHYAVAARAPIEIGDAPAGAVPAAALLREAAALEPQRFADSYRGRDIAMTGQFLRLRNYGPGELTAMAGLQPLADAGAGYAAISLGWTQQPSASANSTGPTEILCLAKTNDPTTLTRAAALQTGAPVVVHGTPVGAAKLPSAAVVVISPCALALAP